jgi:hypothetical protein
MFDSDDVFKKKDPAAAAKGIMAAGAYATDPAAQAMMRGAQLGGAMARNKAAKAERRKETAKNAIVSQRKAEYADKGVA